MNQHSIRHCIITPTKFINDPEIGGKSDFILALSHLLDPECTNEYAQALKASGKEIYMDNGLYENHIPEDRNSLLMKVKLMNATVVFAPDHLFNSENTKAEIRQMRYIMDLNKINAKLAFVVQADTVDEYLETYRRAENNPDIDLIGLSILTIPHCRSKETGTPSITLNRVEAIERIQDEIQPKKPAHLLGLGEGLKDLEIAVYYPWIKSNDSCSAFQTGFKEMVYEKGFVPGGKVKEKVDFGYQGELTENQKRCIKKNISTIRSLLNS